jgi:hypothetical protein
VTDRHLDDDPAVRVCVAVDLFGPRGAFVEGDGLRRVLNGQDRGDRVAEVIHSRSVRMLDDHRRREDRQSGLADAKLRVNARKRVLAQYMKAG